MLNLSVKRVTLLLIMMLVAVSGRRLGYAAVLPQVVAAASAALAIETAVTLVRLKKFAWSDSAAITGLIIGGVAAPSASLWRIALVAALAMLSKHLIRVERRNIFNPAAFGLLAGTVFLSVPLSWWIDSLHLLTLVLGSLLFVKLTGRWRLVLTFLASFTALLTIRSGLTAAPLGPELYLYISITSFFAFFMATDPRTAPIKISQQPLFAALIAVGSFLSVIYHPSSIFLGGLLLANLAAAWMNFRALHPRRSSSAAPPSAVKPSAAAPKAASPS